MSLSDTKLRNVKGREKQYKLMDDLGLYALVKPNGSVLWRLDFQLAGKRKTLSFGQYPAVTIKAAREERDKARELLARGEDPTLQRKLDKILAERSAANTFGLIVDEYLEKVTKAKRAEGTIKNKTWLLKDVCKELAPRPINTIKPIEVLTIMQTYEARKQFETAQRIRSNVSAVFRLAVATLRAETDITLALKGAVARPNVTHRAAITDEKSFGALMASIEDYDGWPTIRLALKFLALNSVRPVECRLAEWPEFDLKRRTWTIPASRMKMRREHLVPLSDQAIEVLEEVRRISHNRRYLFCSLRTEDRPISAWAMNSALRRMGYLKTEHVPHGFRSSFSTIMNERKFDNEIIECALAHKDTSVRGIYNRAKYWNTRLTLMQSWADLIDKLIAGKEPSEVAVRGQYDDLI